MVGCGASAMQRVCAGTRRQNWGRGINSLGRNGEAFAGTVCFAIWHRRSNPRYGAIDQKLLELHLRKNEILSDMKEAL